jgi:hypothetical protein
MKKSFDDNLKKKVKKFAKIIGVNDYSYHTYIINEKKPSNQYDIYGSVQIDEDTREAVIRLNKRILKKELDEVDDTIIHELLHVRFNELLSLMATILEVHVTDKKAKKAFESQIERLEHKAIIALTKAIKKD